MDSLIFFFRCDLCYREQEQFNNFLHSAVQFYIQNSFGYGKNRIKSITSLIF